MLVSKVSLTCGFYHKVLLLHKFETTLSEEVIDCLGSCLQHALKIQRTRMKGGGRGVPRDKCCWPRDTYRPTRKRPGVPDGQSSPGLAHVPGSTGQGGRP